MRERTPWTTREATAPLRAFLRTESGSAGILVAAIVAALVWANVSPGSYEAFWRAPLELRVGDFGVARDLRTWVNSGLMTLFFLVVGLETRREIDLGDLRDRRRLLLPLAAGGLGMLIPIGIYLAFNHRGPGAHGWGVAMSTDTALALGALALLNRSVSDRVRAFLLTMFVVDDLVALVLIAVVYSESVRPLPILVAIALFGVLIALLVFGVDRSPVYALLGIGIWAALLTSGVDPIVAGLGIGLAASAYSPGRTNLEAATGLFRLFREQPTPELARSAVTGLTGALSPNARLQAHYHPWSSYLIVPLFGLANAGIAINADFLSRAYTSRITLGIIAGYVIGKPIAIVGVSWLVARLSRGRILPGVGWAAVTAGGTIGAVGFTVSLLIANLAFTGPELAEAKLGILTAAAISALLTGLVFRVTALMPPRRRALALLGDAEQIVDLYADVDPERDHIRGPDDASVTIVEYGDFQCPSCGQAEPAVRGSMLADDDLRYVWRHLPLVDVHPEAQLAAEATEAASVQGAFWAMHDRLLNNQRALHPSSLMSHARELGLDVDRFRADLREHAHAPRVAQDIESADMSGVSGTPTFFINGQRHYGAYDLDSLMGAVKRARVRAAISGGSPLPGGAIGAPGAGGSGPGGTGPA